MFDRVFGTLAILYGAWLLTWHGHDNFLHFVGIVSVCSGIVIAARGEIKE